MREVNMSDRLELAEYFINQGYHVVALAPNKKYPNYANLNSKRLTIEQLDRSINRCYALGLVPHLEFVVVDLDADHGDYNGVTAFDDTFDPQITLTAYKQGSPNQHRFYKNNLALKVRKTGDNAIMAGVDIFTQENLITTLPFYEFNGLDLTKPFYDQLSDSPESFIGLRAYEKKPVEKKQSTFKNHKIENYLAKVEPLEQGSRSAGYRRLMYIMTQRNQMPYDEVLQALIKWDADTINYQAEEPNQFYHALREIR